MEGRGATGRWTIDERVPEKMAVILLRLFSKYVQGLHSKLHISVVSMILNFSYSKKNDICFKIANRAKHFKSLMEFNFCSKLSMVCVSALNARIKRKESKYVGLTWQAAEQNWRVRIKHEGRLVHVGSHANEKEAALMFDKV